MAGNNAKKDYFWLTYGCLAGANKPWWQGVVFAG